MSLHLGEISHSLRTLVCLHLCEISHSLRTLVCLHLGEISHSLRTWCLHLGEISPSLRTLVCIHLGEISHSLRTLVCLHLGEMSHSLWTLVSLQLVCLHPEKKQTKKVRREAWERKEVKRTQKNLVQKAYHYLIKMRAIIINMIL